MTSQPMRDQVEDHLITPKNAALLIIDYQPPQVSSIVSMDHRTLVANIVATARLAKVFALPIVLSTVNVKTDLNKPPIPAGTRPQTRQKDSEEFLSPSSVFGQGVNGEALSHTMT